MLAYRSKKSTHIQVRIKASSSESVLNMVNWGSVTFSLGRKLLEYFRNSDSLLGVRVTATEGRDVIERTGEKEKRKGMDVGYFTLCGLLCCTDEFHSESECVFIFFPSVLDKPPDGGWRGKRMIYFEFHSTSIRDSHLSHTHTSLCFTDLQ